MTEIYNNIFIGSEYDFYTIKNESNWATLHCCKHPFHTDFVGYRGTIPNTHPDYAYKIKDNEMALNLVDMGNFNKDHLNFYKNMFEQSFKFLDEYRLKNYKLLIHCNLGSSRGPTVGMLYTAYIGGFDFADFNTSVAKLQAIYPRYTPNESIYKTTQYLWEYFVIDNRQFQ